MSDIILKVEDISKQYRLGQFGTGTISHDLNRMWAKIRGKEDPYLKVGDVNDRSKAGGSDYVWSLKEVSFEVRQGEVLGIIGKNGAGKSTLLKILSQVTTPTTGLVKIKGRIASLLEVGTGFHPELTGRENIFLNGAILGMTKSEIKSKLDEIVDFSGVAKYLDTPVKRYSSGMLVRLGFAVAAHLEPEILIVDEVLAVGDAEFQRKCLGKMKNVATQGRTVLFVSHNMAAVKSLCSSGMLLVNGRVNAVGSVTDIVSQYQSMTEIKTKFFHEGSLETAPGNENIRIMECLVYPSVGNIISILSGVNIKLSFYCFVNGRNIDVTFEVINEDDILVFHNGAVLTKERNSKVGEYTITCKFPQQLLNTGTYSLNVIFGEDQRYLLLKETGILTFEVAPDLMGSNASKIPGVVYPKLEFEIKQPEI